MHYIRLVRESSTDLATYRSSNHPGLRIGSFGPGQEVRPKISSERRRSCAGSYCKKPEDHIGHRSGQGIWHVWIMNLWDSLDCMAGILVYHRDYAW